ncbi:MAG: flagellar motor switch phosphatase FliY [Armatimonadota bacterium]|nr:flagellar motor switch phosphatase FliY [Armatimonadota bacterium]
MDEQDLQRQVALTDQEVDTIGEVSNIAMGSAATALSTIVGRKVEITTPQVSTVNLDILKQGEEGACIAVQVVYTEGLEGVNLLLIRQRDAAVLVNLMMGGDGSNPPQDLGELELSAISEAMNQMMGSASSAMATFFGTKVGITPPTMIPRLLDLDPQALPREFSGEPLVRIAFHLTVEGAIDSKIFQIMPVSFARRLAAKSHRQSQNLVSTATPSRGRETAPLIPPAEPSRASGQGRMEPTLEAETQVPVAQPAQFAPLVPKGGKNTMGNIDLLLDVVLQVTVELGRTHMPIKEILGLGPGAVIELDKLAGEPVDLYVNEKLFARGEVVVIEENFGVRITEIVTPEERIRSLNSTEGKGG